MKKIGITGGIASGKSLICKVLEEMGYPVFYSDRVSKYLVNSLEELRIAIVSLLGNAAYADGKLNHIYVSEKVFEAPDLLDQLNRLIHPKVRLAFEAWCRQQVSDILFNETALLFETGSYRNFDATVLVTAPLETRIQRAIVRDKTSRSAVLKRINRQWSDDVKISLATFLIVNDDYTPLIRQIEQTLCDLS